MVSSQRQAHGKMVSGLNDDSGDVGIEGVLVTLYDGSVGIILLATTSTDSSGFYTFYGLVGGDCMVVETNDPAIILDVGDVGSS